MIFKTSNIAIIASIASLAYARDLKSTLHVEENARNLAAKDIHTKVIDELDRKLAGSDACMTDALALGTEAWYTEFYTAFVMAIADSSQNVCTFSGTEMDQKIECDFGNTGETTEFKSGCEGAGGAFFTLNMYMNQSMQDMSIQTTVKGFPMCVPASCGSVDDIVELYKSGF